MGDLRAEVRHGLRRLDGGAGVVRLDALQDGRAAHRPDAGHSYLRGCGLPPHPPHDLQHHRGVHALLNLQAQGPGLDASEEAARCVNFFLRGYGKILVEDMEKISW